VSTSLFIDSGQDAGWAAFDGDRLLSCGLGQPMFEVPEIVVMELPNVGRSGARGKVNANSLVLTAARGAFLAGTMTPDRCVYVLPEWWKGQLPKDVTEKRARAALRGIGEFDPVIGGVSGLGAKAHNVWDAIAMGLVWHGRIKGMRIKQSKPLFRSEK
jgi:hypothetical protein